MPKILDISKEKILCVAEEILKKDGYKKLSVRNVTHICGIATGTFYLYFPSKEYLVARIIARDWEASYEKMQNTAESASDFEKGFIALYREVKTFSDNYSNVFREYADYAGSHLTLASRHRMLREQISSCTKKLAQNTGQQHLVPVADMMAESLLAVINQHDLDEKSLTDFIKITIK